MARAKQYTYQIKGNKLSLLEVDINASGDGLNYAYDDGTLTGTTSPFGTSGHALDLGGGSSLLTSPISSVADGLEIEYAYSPKYFIESTDVSTTTASGWDQDNDGNFRLRAAGGTDWTSSPNLSAVEYIVLENAGRFNGLHKVSLVQSTRIVTTTKVSASTSNTDFEKTVTLYYDVNVLNNESDTIDLPPYLSKALVYYVKAKLAEDAMEIEAKEYLMREFKRMVEKHASSNATGRRSIMPGVNSIR